MRKTVPFVFALLVALATLPVLASTPNTGPKPWDSNFAGEDGALPTAVTNHLKCVITEVKDDRVVKMWDEKSRTEHLLRIAEEVSITPRKKKHFEGRSDLDFEDLKVGHRLKLTYLMGDGTIVRVKVLEEVDTLPGTTIRLADRQE